MYRPRPNLLNRPTTIYSVYWLKWDLNIVGTLPGRNHSMRRGGGLGRSYNLLLEILKKYPAVEIVSLIEIRYKPKRNLYD